MAIITRITQQKRDTRVNIYLDNKFGFGLDLENFMKLGLKVEQELSDDQVKEIVKKSEFTKTYEKLLRFAMLRPRSEREVRNWFKKKLVPESIQTELFDKLKHLELIDDVKFARWWVEQRVNFRPKSKRALKMELAQKGIGSETISDILEESDVNEKDIALKLALKKPGLEKEKLIAYLGRRGFSWETIDAVVSELVKYDLGENTE